MKPAPHLAVLRIEALWGIGRIPPWWKPLARRRWIQRYRSIMSASITEYDEMIAREYTPEAIEALVNRKLIPFARLGKR